MAIPDSMTRALAAQAQGVKAAELNLPTRRLTNIATKVLHAVDDLQVGIGQASSMEDPESALSKAIGQAIKSLKAFSKPLKQHTTRRTPGQGRHGVSGGRGVQVARSRGGAAGGGAAAAPHVAGCQCTECKHVAGCQCTECKPRASPPNAQSASRVRSRSGGSAEGRGRSGGRSNRARHHDRAHSGARTPQQGGHRN